MRGKVLEQSHGEQILDGHLGGCSIGGDGGTYYPNMWEHVVDTLDIKSVLDIGCGVGYASAYFQSLGCSIKCIDGSEKVKENSIIKEHLVINDYEKQSALGKFDTGRKSFNERYDLCWSCEFVEHVHPSKVDNFLIDMSACKYVMFTYASRGQGGHNHVNENSQEYWVHQMQRYGYIFDREFTRELRSKAFEDMIARQKLVEQGKALPFTPHFTERGLFFRK